MGVATALVIIGFWKNPFGLNVYSGFWAMTVATITYAVVSLSTKSTSVEVLRRFNLAPALPASGAATGDD